jgi:histidinol-phosphate phosphatase family protein
VTFDVVIPTTLRPSLAFLLTRLGALGVSGEWRPDRVIVVRDGGPGSHPELEGLPRWLNERMEVIAGRGAGPAAARNRGWRAASAPWVVFLDDDVVPGPDWLWELEADLSELPPDVAASQGRLSVPLEAEGRPTDWQRSVKGLETAAWITADLAVRRSALEAVGGFDERFPRAFREDADLALRLMRSGYRLVRGRRRSVHPARNAGVRTVLRREAGNADDVLMAALHGPRWHEKAGAELGRRRANLATTAAAAVALAGLVAGRRRAASLGGISWLASTAAFAWRRIAPGPRTPREIVSVLTTSVLIPPLATAHRVAGYLRLPSLLYDRERAPGPLPDAVLLDRDGTLVIDVAYNGEPDRVVPVPNAREALDRLRAAGVPLGVVSNQSGVARGLITRDEVEAVNRRLEALLGPIETWAVCVHGPDDGCHCRKPAPGLVRQAAEALGADPRRCVVIGDIGTDVAAAQAAGARAILVPSSATRREEIEAAPVVAESLSRAVDIILGGLR